MRADRVDAEHVENVMAEAKRRRDRSTEADKAGEALARTGVQARPWSVVCEQPMKRL